MWKMWDNVEIGGWSVQCGDGQRRDTIYYLNAHLDLIQYLLNTIIISIFPNILKTNWYALLICPTSSIDSSPNLTFTTVKLPIPRVYISTSLYSCNHSILMLLRMYINSLKLQLSSNHWHLTASLQVSSLYSMETHLSMSSKRCVNSERNVHL